MGRRVAGYGLGAALALGLGGCAGTPMGPTVAVMPAANKPFEAFAQDQGTCKQYAAQEVGGQAETANNQAVAGALVTTALGAGLGAAIGGGGGAAIGAASGALLGSGVGANASSWSQLGIQRRYDIAYTQCMAAKGNQVPKFSGAYAPPPPPPFYPAPMVYYYPPPWGYYRYY